MQELLTKISSLLNERKQSSGPLIWGFEKSGGKGRKKMLNALSKINKNVNSLSVSSFLGSHYL